jgi:hypothetical protein
MAGNLENQLRYLFSGPAVTRGRTYYVRGAVRILSFDNNAVQAVVAGSSRYKVSLRLAENSVVLDCNCSFKAEYQKPCKHIWATLLACDDDGIWKTVQNLGGLTDETTLPPRPAVRSSPAWTRWRSAEAPCGSSKTAPTGRTVSSRPKTPPTIFPIERQRRHPFLFRPSSADAPRQGRLHAPVVPNQTPQERDPRRFLFRCGSRPPKRPARILPRTSKVLSALMGFKAVGGSAHQPLLPNQASRFQLTPSAAGILLPWLAPPGRCMT